MATAPFSRFRTGLKIPTGQRAQYIRNQGWTTAPIKAPKAVMPAAPKPNPTINPADPYGSAIKNEGIFASDSANIGADNTAAQAQRDAAVKALQFQYNDPANPFSTVGEAERDRKRAVAQMAANRGARGVASSGGTTLAQMDIGHDYSKGLYNSLNDVTGRIGGLNADLAETQRANFGRMQGAIDDSQQRLINAGIVPGGAGGAGLGSAPATIPGVQGVGPSYTVGGKIEHFTPEQMAYNTAQSMKSAPLTPEAKRQYALNKQGYQTYFAGGPEETYRKLAPGKDYTWEMHLQDLVKAGKAKTVPGFDYAGRPLPGLAAQRGYAGRRGTEMAKKPKIVIGKAATYTQPRMGIGTAATYTEPHIGTAAKFTEKPLLPQPRGLGFKTKKGQVFLDKGESVHFKPGMGYYAAKKGTGQSFGEPKVGDKGGGGSSLAPTAPKASERAAAVAAAAPDEAGVLANYNLARAKILQDMAPQVQDMYHRAGTDLTSTVGGLTQDLQKRLYDVGGGQGAAFGTIDPRIADSYNIDSAPNAAYNLGAAIPGESLAKQGAAYGAAAAFAPERALQEGQYAIQAAVADAAKQAAAAGASNAKLSAIDAAGSKVAGYLVDKGGNIISGKDGKPIPIAQPGITPYQQASLGLQGARIEAGIKSTNARLEQSNTNSIRSTQAQNARTAAGLEFKSAQAKQVFKKNSKLVDKTTSVQKGHLVDKNGNPITDSHGRLIKVSDATKPKTASLTQKAALDKTIQAWYTGNTGMKVIKNADGTYGAVPTPRQGGKMNYQVALRRLQKTFGLKLQDAQDMLDTYYKLPDDFNKLQGKTPKQIMQITRGRPLLNFQDRQGLIKQYKLPRALVEKAAFDIAAYAQVNHLYEVAKAKKKKK